ncbi:MAG: SPOR domain-containing protein [Bacteroidales bacterium]|nr:SPOR domain-containing protein [Bacteroidales bacterium]
MNVINKSLGLLFAAALVLSSCKSNKEAYSATYERAKAKQEIQAQVNDEQDEQIEVIEKTGVKEAAEKIEVIGLAGESGPYAVVVGSFINRTNAENLRNKMIDQGYKAVLGQNEKLMYRVIVAFYEVKADAQAKVRELSNDFPDAWILIKE